jgi:SAM-dependent methyltransferase
VTAQQRWLTTLWPKVRSYLPPPPATIVEIGCGRLGGFVPMLRDSGYEAVGIDPVAPEGESYRHIEFEQSDLPGHADGVIACTSLHHVADPDEVLDKVANALAPAGLVIVVEWDWEGFDEASARWCFERLGPSEPESWLHHRRDGWAASGQTWEDYLFSWAREHGLHSARRLVRDLDQRFDRLVCGHGPYFFPELFDTSETEELEAINAGLVRAARIDYVGRRVAAGLQ